MVIADDNPKALKIRQGYEFDYTAGELLVGNLKTGYNVEDFEQKLNNGIVTPLDINDFLKEVVKLYKKLNWQ